MSSQYFIILHQCTGGTYGRHTNTVTVSANGLSGGGLHLGAPKVVAVVDVPLAAQFLLATGNVDVRAPDILRIQDCFFARRESQDGTVFFPPRAVRAFPVAALIPHHSVLAVAATHTGCARELGPVPPAQVARGGDELPIGVLVGAVGPFLPAAGHGAGGGLLLLSPPSPPSPPSLPSPPPAGSRAGWPAAHFGRRT